MEICLENAIYLKLGVPSDMQWCSITTTYYSYSNYYFYRSLGGLSKQLMGDMVTCNYSNECVNKILIKHEKLH